MVGIPGHHHFEERRLAASGPAAISSFEAFYRANYQDVVRLAASVLGDFHGAQDVAQDVFLAAHRRFWGDVDRAPVGTGRWSATDRSLAGPPTAYTRAAGSSPNSSGRRLRPSSVTARDRPAGDRMTKP